MNQELIEVMRITQIKCSEWIRDKRKFMNWAGIGEEELQMVSKNQVCKELAEVVHR